jgi:diguanylate cyclase (GGDEF)-like protein/PAS domain S-box-containing protein
MLVDVAVASLDLATGVESLLCALVEQVEVVLGDRATVWLPGFYSHELPAVASSQPDAVEAVLEQFCLSGELADHVVVWSVRDPEGAWLAPYQLDQCAVLPVSTGTRALGVLAVTRATGRALFSDDELELLTVAAALTAALAIQKRVVGDSVVALEELRRQVELADTISDALIACDASGQIVNWNAAAEQIYGYPASEALGCDVFALLATELNDPEDGPVGREELMRMVVAQGRWQGELHERGANGAPLVVLSSVTLVHNRAGLVEGFVVVNRDVTEQRHEEYLAMRDPLTSLPNRRVLDRALFDAFARACRSGNTLAVLFIDLDGFKPINDTYGHAAGDEVLCAVARRLLAVLRRPDIAGRLGGDEFLAILEAAGDLGMVRRIAERVADAIGEPVTLADGQRVTARASVGVAVTEHPDELRTDAQGLLRAADQAMYSAKAMGCGIVLTEL